MKLQHTHTGATLLIASLAAQGVDTVFCVPGESYLASIRSIRKNSNIRPVTDLSIAP